MRRHGAYFQAHEHPVRLLGRDRVVLIAGDDHVALGRRPVRDRLGVRLDVANEDNVLAGVRQFLLVRYPEHRRDFLLHARCSISLRFAT